MPLRDYYIDKIKLEVKKTMIEQENVIAVVCAMYKALPAEDKNYILGYMAGRMNAVADRDEQAADAAQKIS